MNIYLKRMITFIFLFLHGAVQPNVRLADVKFTLGAATVGTIASLSQAYSIYSKEMMEHYKQKAIREERRLTDAQILRKYKKNFSYIAFMRSYFGYLGKAFIGSAQFKKNHKSFYRTTQLLPVLLGFCGGIDYALFKKLKAPKVVINPPNNNIIPIKGRGTQKDTPPVPQPVLVPHLSNLIKLPTLAKPILIECCICLEQDPQQLSYQMPCQHDGQACCDNCLEQLHKDISAVSLDVRHEDTVLIEHTNDLFKMCNPQFADPYYNTIIENCANEVLRKIKARNTSFTSYDILKILNEVVADMIYKGYEMGYFSQDNAIYYTELISGQNLKNIAVVRCPLCRESLDPKRPGRPPVDQ